MTEGQQGDFAGGLNLIWRNVVSGGITLTGFGNIVLANTIQP